MPSQLQTEHANSTHHDTESWADWRQYAERIVPAASAATNALTYFDLVQVCCDDAGQPLKLMTDWTKRGFYLAYTTEAAPASAKNLRSFMLGNLIEMVRDIDVPIPVLINPNWDLVSAWPEKWTCEQVLWSALKDTLTGKLMTSPPDEALALLAIDGKDQERFGINLVFHMISNHAAPESGEERSQYLKDKIQELAHFIPRTPIAFGSSSIYCVLLNLENPMEETAFIRDYQTFDPYSDVLFVTSSLELLTGQLKSINFQGEQIDTIFGPIIEWQRQHNLLRAQWQEAREHLQRWRH